MLPAASRQARYEGSETGHFADDGRQAPDGELSLTILNGKKFKQTIKARDRGSAPTFSRAGSSPCNPRRTISVWPRERNERPDPHLSRRLY